MNQNATGTCVKVDKAMYFARVIIFDFATNGTGLSIFSKIK